MPIDQDGLLTASVEALESVEEDLRLRLGSHAAHAVVAGMTLLCAERGEPWLEQCAQSPHVARRANDLVSGHLADTLATLGFDAAFDELHRRNLNDQAVHRIARILLDIEPAHRLAVANRVVSRAADPSVGAFTVPTELAELGGRVAAAMLPASKDDTTPQMRIGFDPCVGCGEMIAGLGRVVTRSPGDFSAYGYARSAETLAIARTSVALTGVSPDGLRLGEWLTQPSVAAPDFHYLVSAIEATPWRRLEPWVSNELDLPALPRSSDSSLLYLAAIARCISERPQSVAVVLVNSAALTVGPANTGDAQLRRFIAETGVLNAVVTLPGGLFERTSMAPTMVVLRHPSPGTNNDSFRLVDARDLAQRTDRRRPSLSPEDIQLIVNALSDSNGVPHSVVPTSLLAQDGRWRIPPVTRRLHSTSSTATDVVEEERLVDLCEILPGRNRVDKDASDAHRERIVRAEDIGQELTPWSELKRSTPRKASSVEVLPGDIIGSISPPYGRWSLVPDGYGPTFASDHTLVLRARRPLSMRYLLGYLRSEGAKGYLVRMFRGTIPRLDRDQLAELPVTHCPLPANYLDDVLSGYDAEVARLEAEIGQLRHRVDDIYRGASSVEIAARIDGLHGITASLRSLENLNGALRIAKASFPYPISRTLRAIDRTRSPRERYHEVVHQGLETISTVLTVVSAATARARALSGKSMKNWAGQVARSGATIGAQRAMFTEAARAVLSFGSAADLGGIGQALGDATSPAVVAFEQLLVERNRIHGDYPRSDYEFQQRLAHAEGAMAELLDGLSFLARWELRYAESIEPIEGTDGQPDFSGRFALLRGDNPDWNMADQVSERPLYRGRVYALVDQRELVDLHPYLLVRDCPQCGAKEVYHPDSFGSTEANLKSLDRGHSQTCTDEWILKSLREAFTAFS
ncbi:N-6 DNA methylase [Polymorphospora rubra]|uniref:N-6 DNA methylase n=1 Tax=Polymorphospora rubra TaxID=338584 RepID=UPI0033EFFDB8